MKFITGDNSVGSAVEFAVEFAGEESILDLAIENKIAISNSCGGMGTCGTCRVHVVKGLELLEARGEVEQEIAGDRGFAPSERLACQTAPCDGVVITVPAVDLDLLED